MRRKRVLTTSVGAALGCAIAATAAVAAPPEFSAPYPKAFHGAGPAMTLETINGFKVTCVSTTTQGEVAGAGTALLTVTFKGCNGSGGTGSCQNVNLAGGEFATEPLTGTLGYLNPRHSAVGVDLANAAGGPMIRFFCGEDLTVEVFGSLIGRITPINRTVGRFRLTFVQKGGHQALRRLLGGPTDVPTTTVLYSAPTESGIGMATSLIFASPVELIA